MNDLLLTILFYEIDKIPRNDYIHKNIQKCDQYYLHAYTQLLWPKGCHGNIYAAMAMELSWKMY